SPGIASHGGNQTKNERSAQATRDTGSRYDPVDSGGGRAGADAAGRGGCSADGTEPLGSVRAAEPVASARWKAERMTRANLTAGLNRQVPTQQPLEQLLQDP